MEKLGDITPKRTTSDMRRPREFNFWTQILRSQRTQFPFKFEGIWSHVQTISLVITNSMNFRLIHVQMEIITTIIFILIWKKTKIPHSERTKYSTKRPVLPNAEEIMHWENYASNFFHIEWDMIIMTVFLSILNQMEFHLVNVKEIGSIVFST